MFSLYKEDIVKKIAILQPNYIPWKGVFDMINQVDVFVFLDDVDFTVRDWRTRNKIKTPSGDIWLTVPVRKSKRGTKINEIEILSEDNWQEKHYKTIVQYYKKSKYFKEYSWILDKIYKERVWKNLSEFNIYTTKLISDILGIKTSFINSKELNIKSSKGDKILEICTTIGGEFYLSGPAAKDYIDAQKFKDVNIRLAYMKYEYPEYSQIYGDFNHYVSILDVIFNCGESSGKFIFMNKSEEIQY